MIYLLATLTLLGCLCWLGAAMVAFAGQEEPR